MYLRNNNCSIYHKYIYYKIKLSMTINFIYNYMIVKHHIICLLKIRLYFHVQRSVVRTEIYALAL